MSTAEQEKILKGLDNLLEEIKTIRIIAKKLQEHDKSEKD